MKTFKDWANCNIAYRFKLNKTNNLWECYLGLGKDYSVKDNLGQSPNWSCFASNKTKNIALINAIKEWNDFDQNTRYKGLFN